MTTVADPVMSIERFAELSALLAEPFADRLDVLRRAGLDAAGWERLEAEWSARLQAADGSDLVRRFSAAYAAMLAELAKPGLPAAEPVSTPSSSDGPRVSCVVPSTLPSPLPPTPEATLRRHPLTGTVDADAALPSRPALPFAPGAVSVHVPAPPSGLPAPGRLGDTLPANAHLPRPALPFSSSDVAPAPPPGAPTSKP